MIIHTVKARQGACALIKPLIICVMVLLIGSGLQAQSNILNLEAQIAGSIVDENWNWYSHHQHDAMQKPSLGLDYVYRAGTSDRDYGYVSLQTRMVYDELSEHNIQLQLYNAFVNYKGAGYDVWLGHNKTPLGLSSYLDNHALLLTDNTMSGINFDRDWGLGIKLNRQTPDMNIAITNGSGMPLYFGDNYLLSGRLGFGELNREDFSMGLSAGYGKTLRSMGYVIMHNKEAHDYRTLGLDFAKRYLNLYLMGDLLYGEYHQKRAYSGLLRAGLFLLPEERSSLEIQAMLSELAGEKSQIYSVGFTYKVNADISLRSVYDYEYIGAKQKIALQVYYLKGLVF